VSIALRRRRNDTIRFGVGLVLNWALAGLVVWISVSDWSGAGASAGIQASALFVSIAIVNSIGLVLARRQSVHSGALVAISYACVCTPFVWVFVFVLAV
jgi:hypothetical protein